MLRILEGSFSGVTSQNATSRWDPSAFFPLPLPFVILVKDSAPTSHLPVFFLSQWIHCWIRTALWRNNRQLQHHRKWPDTKRCGNWILVERMCRWMPILGDNWDPSSLPSRSRSGGNELGSQFRFLTNGLCKLKLGRQRDVAIWDVTPEKEPS